MTLQKKTALGGLNLHKFSVGTLKSRRRRDRRRDIGVYKANLAT